MTRILVIGAGHNGLVAAVDLAEAGLEVVVLEHGPTPGGATRSSARTLPGFVHDDHAAFVPMTVASPAMRELELEREGLRWITPPAVMAHPFEDGSAIVLRRDVGETVASLGGAAGSGWERAMAQLLPHATTLVETVLAPLPPVAGPLRMAASLRRDGLDWARRLLGSVEALGLEIFAGDRRATAWLSGSAQHSGLPPSTAGSGAFGLLLQLLGHATDGRCRWAGWARSPTRSHPGRAGGRTGALWRDGRADHGHGWTGARGAAGGRRGGRRERRGQHDQRPARGADAGAWRPTWAAERRLCAWRYGTGAFKIDYALSGPVPWTATSRASPRVVHVAGGLTELSAAAEAGALGAVPERPALVVGQQSLYDATRAPDGQHTLYVYAHVPSRSGLGDEEVAARMEAQLERFAPGFGDRVLARAVRSPAATEAENPSMVGGDLGGGTMELDQQLIFRPAPELSRYRTPVRGLYVAGASTHPGGAVHGMSGRAAARALLHDRWRRPWRVRMRRRVTR